MRKISLGVALLFILQIGASVPEKSADSNQNTTSSNVSSDNATFSAMTTPQSVGDQIAKYFGRKTGKELMAKKSGISETMQKKSSTPMKSSLEKSRSESNSKRQVSPKTTFPKVVSRSMQPGYVVPPPPVIAPVVPKMRQEIQRILDLNKRIQNLQGTRVKQIQQVRDQAKAHQQILTGLERVQTVQPSAKIPTKLSILGQEKLRVRHEQSKHNIPITAPMAGGPSKTAAVIETPAKKAAGPQAVEKVKTAAA